MTESINQMKQIIEDAEFVLVGVGEEFAYKEDSKHTKEEIESAYAALGKLVTKKPYFVVSQNEDSLIYNSKFMDFFISAPFAREVPAGTNQDEQWKSYLNWLTSTLNHKLCILLLGVGIMQPQLIRWPFEKTAQMNMRSTLVNVHHNLAFLPEGLGERGMTVKADAVEFLNSITE